MIQIFLSINIEEKEIKSLGISSLLVSIRTFTEKAKAVHETSTLMAHFFPPSTRK